MGFKIGDKVVCIKSHSDGYFNKGDEFVISGVYAGCCVPLVTIGLMLSPYELGSRCDCGKNFDYEGEAKYNANRFRKIEPTKKSNSVTKALVEKFKESERELVEYQPEEINIPVTR